MSHRVQYRRDTKERWEEINPILMEGEVGFETDTHHQKIGDGVHAWNDLEYEIGIGNIAQELGNSENLAISQKAVNTMFTAIKTWTREELAGKAGVFYTDNVSGNTLVFADEASKEAYLADQSKTELLLGVISGGGGTPDLSDIREGLENSVCSVGVNFGFSDEVKIWHEKNNREINSASIPAASQNAAGVMSKEDKKKLDSIIPSGLIVSNNGGAALNICDTNGNVIVRFSGGHIRTKFFDSRNYSTDTTPDDMSIKGTSIIVKDADFTGFDIGEGSVIPPSDLQQLAYSFPFTLGG